MYYDQARPFAIKISSATMLSQYDVTSSIPRQYGPELPYSFDRSTGTFNALGPLRFRVSGGDTITVVTPGSLVGIGTLILNKPMIPPSPSPSPNPYSGVQPGMYYDQAEPIVFKVSDAGIQPFDTNNLNTLGEITPYKYDASSKTFRVPAFNFTFTISGTTMTITDQFGNNHTLILNRPRA
jgi:hypothetical protein